MPVRHAHSRRRFMQLAVSGALGASLAGLLRAPPVRGAEKPELDPESEQAQQLSYTHDADSTDSPARKEGANCGSCAHFHGDSDAQWASCNIFPEHLVNADGWCKSWFARSG